MQALARWGPYALFTSVRYAWCEWLEGLYNEMLNDDGLILPTNLGTSFMLGGHCPTKVFVGYSPATFGQRLLAFGKRVSVLEPLSIP
jgi:hypothetical protein